MTEGMKTREHRLRMLYVVSDYVMTSLAVLLFNVARYNLLPSAHRFTVWDFLSEPNVVAGQILFPIGMLYVYFLSGYYHRVIGKSRIQELSTTMITAFAGTLVVIFVALINDLTNDRAQDYRVFFMIFALLFGLVYLPRVIITNCTMRRVERGELYYRTAVIADLVDEERVAELVRGLSPLSLLKPVCVCEMDRAADGHVAGLPAMGLSGLEAISAAGQVERLLVMPSQRGWETTLNVINRLFALGLPIYIGADTAPSYLFNTRLVSLTADPFIDVSRVHIPASTLNIKRSFDVVISALALVVLAVPLAIAALAIKLDSRGPVVYRQRRVGMHGSEFEILKLRTMHVDAESRGKPELSHEDDPRVTRVGRVLRKYRIDECMQFVNVLRGDMSLVGPRPERRYFVEKIKERAPSYVLVHRVRPGITSLGMVRFGYASNVDQMVARLKYDLLYLENMSLLTDIKIIVYTVSTVLGGKGV